MINFLILMIYQIKVGGDFPYQDEWGYVDRLIHLQSMGMSHYLFDRYQVYFIPGIFAIWYFFYHFFDLSIMAIRYAGAAVSAIIAFFICVTVIKHKEQFNMWELVLIGLIPFVFCSLNHWATYNQSIESVIEPFLFGCVLFAFWAGQHTMNDEDGDWKIMIWSILVVIASVLAVTMYAPGLSALLAVAITRIFLLRRIDKTTIMFGLLGFGGGLAYLLLGGGAGHHIPLATVHIGKVIEEWIFLFSNALITIGHKTSPVVFFGVPIIYGVRLILDFIIGFIIIATMIISMAYVFFVLPHDRMKYFIPFALSLYTFGVSLEIVWAYHSPHFGEAPRYAILMVGGPISALIWGVLLLRVYSLQKLILIAQSIIAISVFSTLVFMWTQISYVYNSFEGIRTELLKINAPITKEQEKIIVVNDPLKDLVYPDLLFLRKNHLSLFQITHSK